MSCSTRTIVTSCRSSASSFTMRADSVTPKPAIGSSSSSNCGWVASATASSSSRCSPWLNFETTTSARLPSPTRSSVACAVSRSPFSLRALPKKRNECPSRACAASATLSAAVKFGSSEVIWNERASPSRLRFHAGRCVTSWPAKRMVPAVGRNWPINWLISVVLPAPFGPMIACNSPRAISSERLSVATMPPNRRTRFSIRSRGSATGKPPDQPHNAATTEQHDQKQQRPHDHSPVFGDLRQKLLEHEIDDGADDGAEQRSHAAEDDHHHEIAGAGPVHHGRADEIGVIRQQRTGQAAHRAGNDKASQLISRRWKTDRLHTLFVRAQALHHETEARIDDTPDQKAPAEQAKQAEVIELDAVRQVDQAAEGAAFIDRQPVIAAITRQAGGDIIGHLREGERDHDEIDAARAQGQCADHERKQ